MCFRAVRAGRIVLLAGIRLRPSSVPARAALGALLLLLAGSEAYLLVLQAAILNRYCIPCCVLAGVVLAVLIPAWGDRAALRLRPAAGLLLAAAGFLGLQLADEPVRCTRYGKLPPDGRSRNGATGEMEPGVSVVSAGDDSSSTANFTVAFIIDRPMYTFRGLVVEGRRGSDGEPLVIPLSVARKSQ